MLRLSLFVWRGDEVKLFFAHESRGGGRELYPPSQERRKVSPVLRRSASCFFSHVGIFKGELTLSLEVSPFSTKF